MPRMEEDHTLFLHRLRKCLRTFKHTGVLAMVNRPRWHLYTLLAAGQLAYTVDSG